MQYSRENPSARYRELIRMYQDMHVHGERFKGVAAQDTFDGRSLRKEVARIKRLIDQTGAVIRQVDAFEYSNLPLIVGAILAILLIGLTLRAINQPQIVGYIVAGLVIGPHGIALLDDPDLIGRIGGFGLIVLLFFVGMEASPGALLKRWRLAIFGVILQVATAVGLVWLAWASRYAERGTPQTETETETETCCFHFNGDRIAIRAQTVAMALNVLIDRYAQ